MARSGRTLGLMVEIVIVTIIGWMVIEPVAVKTAIAHTPTGYDCERLVEVRISKFEKSSYEFDSNLPSGSQQEGDDLRRLLDMVRKRDGVENATFSLYQGFEHEGESSMYLETDTLYHMDGEDSSIKVYMVNYIPGTDFFTTYGIKGNDGKPFKEPTDMTNSFIVSNTVAKASVPDGQVIGKNLFETQDRPSPIRGVVEDIPYRKGEGRSGIAYRLPYRMEDGITDYVYGIVVRLGDNVNPRKFIDSLISDISFYRSGNYYITHPVYLPDVREDSFASQHRELVQKWIIVIFFLVNVFLGIAGTFYVQCRARIPDAGVMRAFGATRRRIEWSIVGEACIMACIGWIIGTILYMLYMKYQGFPMESDTDFVIRQIRPLWYDTKAGRYGVIGGIILLLLIITSALGAWLPARKVGRVSTVDALRDE